VNNLTGYASQLFFWDLNKITESETAEVYQSSNAATFLTRPLM